MGGSGVSEQPGGSTSGGPSGPPPPPGVQPPAPPHGTPPAAPPQGAAPPAWGPTSPTAQAAWDAPRPDAGNGCLKACLIVGGILLVLAIIAIAGLAVLGGRIAEQIREDPEAFFGGPCPYVSDFELSEAVGENVTAMTLEGFADGTMGALLDKRLLADAPDCWVVSEDGFAARIAVADGGGAAAFDDAAGTAADDGFRGEDVTGLGDQAICTTLSAMGSSGALVRFGERVVYVSIVQENPLANDTACSVAADIARTLQP
jgi:hypothetical protein